RAGEDWAEIADVIAPARINAPVRQLMVAERLLSDFSVSSMLRSAILYDLVPLYDAALTRLFLLPLLGVARLAGDLLLRRVPSKIDSPFTAGGLVALAQAPSPYDENDVIGHGQALLKHLLLEAGEDIDALAKAASRYFDDGQP